MNRRFAALLAAGTIALSACSFLNVGHISLLRDDQDRFAKLADRENRLTLAATVPGGSPVSETPPASFLAAAADPASARELQRGYQELYDSLSALTRQAGSELKEDRLLGSALTLRVLAQWRSVFYAHLLRAHETGGADEAPAPAALPPALSAVVGQAASVLQTLEKEKIELFPRDRFLLRAMKPLVRYDIAYVRSFADEKTGKLRVSDEGKAIVQDRAREILEADNELVAAAAGESPQIRRYAFLARLPMLRTATILGLLTYDMAERRRKMPDLAGRIDELHRKYGEDEALRNLIGIKADVLLKILPLIKE